MKTLILTLMLSIATISVPLMLAQPATADEKTYTSGGPSKEDGDTTATIAPKRLPR